MMSREGWLERDLVGDMSAHEREKRLWVKRAANASVRGRGLLLAAFAALIVACLLGPGALWWAIPCVLLVRFVVGLLDGRTRQAAGQLARRMPIELPTVDSFSEGRARRLVERLESAREATGTAIGSRPAGAAFEVAPFLEPIPQLERDIVVLAARIEYLSRFLGSSPQLALGAELTELERQRCKVDAAGSKQLDRLIAQCRQHADLLNELTKRRNEACAAAEELLHGIEQVPARVMSLQLARIESCDTRLLEASKEAAAMNETFGVLERATADLPEGEASAP
jgi:hypothetical protein